MEREALEIEAALARNAAEVAAADLAESAALQEAAALSAARRRTAAEALADLLQADTEVQRRLAVGNSTGAQSRLYAGWRETLLRQRALVEALCFTPPGEGEAAAYWGAHLAGQFLVESAGLTDLAPPQAQHVDRVRGWLVHVLTDPVLPAVERALAGRHLAQLGDPRPEATSLDAMQFCYVPPGDFIMGEMRQGIERIRAIETSAPRIP